MAQALTETALRKSLDDMSLVPADVRRMYAGSAFEVFEADLYASRVSFDDQKRLSDVFGTTSLFVEAKLGPPGPQGYDIARLTLTIAASPI